MTDRVRMLATAAREEALGRLCATRATKHKRNGMPAASKAARRKADEHFRKAMYSRKVAAFIDNPDDPRHGTPNGYINLACRCLRCSHAHSVYQRGAPMRGAMKRMGA